ncbi:Panacea domain-containing protein [Neobacillus drentensis]|uniref:Panacea domain-containing protein n=1 Tax=Neobacillus drentensis TaxID=220684 RepID=UPI0030005AD4
MAKIYYISDRVGKMVTQTAAITSINNVAEAFLTFDTMSHKKLQKLCYYAYSWYLALYGEKLFNEHFEAWIHGPVSPVLYSEFKKHGWKEIPRTNSVSDEINNNDAAIELINEVYRSYGDLSGDELEYLTHQEDPWLMARGDLPEFIPSNQRIDDRVIIDFYQREFEEAQND